MYTQKKSRTDSFIHSVCNFYSPLLMFRSMHKCITLYNVNIGLTIIAVKLGFFNYEIIDKQIPSTESSTANYIMSLMNSKSVVAFNSISIACRIALQRRDTHTHQHSPKLLSNFQSIEYMHSDPRFFVFFRHSNSTLKFSHSLTFHVRIEFNEHVLAFAHLHKQKYQMIR